MKKHYVKDLRENDSVRDFFFIKSSVPRLDKKGNTYLDMILADATGEVNAKRWGATPDEIGLCTGDGIGKIIKVDAVISDFNGRLQMKINQLRRPDPEGRPDDGEITDSDFYKAAPEDPSDMYEYIIGRIEDFQDEDLRKLCLAFYRENRDKLMYWPAAMSNHHAEYAGLLYHIKRMMMMGERACEVYTNLSKDLLLAGIALHDIEKLTEIESDEHGVSPGYSFEGQMLGHLVQGVKVIHDKCVELGIGEEKEIMLEHMCISHHYEPEFGSPKKPLFPEAEMLHYLDVADAKMFDMEDELKGVDAGEFGNKVWTLDNRRPYKRTF